MQELPAAALQFIESVLALHPKVAVFDCDGTLWSGDCGADFFYWEMSRGIVSATLAGQTRAQYAEYKAGKVDEETMCGAMVAMNDGVPERLLEEASEKFFLEAVQHRVFPEMLHLTRRLKEMGCALWAVSSTNVWTVRAGVRQFGIPEDHVLAACVHIENGCATSRIDRVPTGPGKARALRETFPDRVDVCFGNSVHDAAMLEIALHAFAVNPNPDLEAIAGKKGWKIYWPTGTRS